MNQALKSIYRRHKRLAVFLSIVLLGVFVMGTVTLLGVIRAVDDLNRAPSARPYYPVYPPLSLTKKSESLIALIKQGEYLTKAGDCIACHTDTARKEAKPFAGGLAMPTPFGTIYSPNITPDKKTGIGDWSAEDFKKAMHEGKNPHGHFYYPAFPYPYFSEVREEDLNAIKAYLDQLPSVRQENRKNKMVFPFNFRWLQWGWRLLFFHPKGAYAHQPKQTAEWNRGKYIVDGLGHCAMCHSPSYYVLTDTFSLGAPMRQYDLTGAKIQGYLAPNITRANLAQVSVTEGVNIFRQDKRVGGGKIMGPMLEVNHDSLSYLTTEDLASIVTYLKTVESEQPPIKQNKEGPGAGIYDKYCSACHTSGAGGAPKFKDKLAWQALVKEKGLDRLHRNALSGINSMPAKGTCLSCDDEAIKAAVDYMVYQSTGNDTATPITSLPKGLKPAPLSLEEGKRIYAHHCSVCHDSGFKNAPKVGDKEAWQSVVDSGFLQAYVHTQEGYKDHPPKGACSECSDADIKAALKYLLQSASVDKDYRLW